MSVARFLRAASLVGLLHLAAPAQEDSPPPLRERGSDMEEPVPRRATAQAQLEHARRLRLASGEPLDRVRAVDAYRAVRRHHPAARTEGAEAAFRAGALLAAAGDVEGALEELRLAHELGGGTAFRPRAGLEIGRLERARGRRAAALDAWFEVAATPVAPELERYAFRAWVRVGDLWTELGRLEDACRAYRHVAGGAPEVHRRVHAYDRWGLAYLHSGDLEAAAGVLARCRDALRPLCAERTQAGERARRALERMRLVVELPSAIEARWRAGGGGSH